MTFSLGLGQAAGVRKLSSRRDFLLPGLFFLCPFISSTVPRLTPALLAALGLSLIVLAWRRGVAWRELLQPKDFLAACLLAALYVFLNATWAAHPGDAFGKAAVLTAAILVTFASASALTKLDERELDASALAFTAGALLGASFVMFELLTDGAITRALMNLVPFLHPDSGKHASIKNGMVTGINMSLFNHNATLLMLQLWPGLLLLSLLASARTLVMSVFFVALSVPLLLSQHESSQVALVGSVLVWLLARQWPALVVRGLAVLWCAGFIVVIPLAFLVYKEDVQRTAWLPSSFRARIIIWEYTAERVFEHPWLGVGATSTRALHQPRAEAERPEGFVFPRATGQHAHNLFLQTWYELGLVGALLVAVAGAFAALRILALPPQAQPFAAATFAAFAAIASFAWGMWQTWWICAIGLAALYLCLGAVMVRETPRRASAAGRSA